MANRKITLHDVSRLAQVSTATVSYVINGTHPVTESTRNKVLDAVKELGYVPDARARSLKSSRIRILSVYFPYSNESTSASKYFRDIIASVCATAGTSGYQVLINYVSRSKNQKIQIEEICRSGTAGGIILVGLSPEEFVQVEDSLQGFPSILLSTSNPRFSYVDVDNREGMIQAVKLLVDRGHRRISYINSAQVDSHSIQRQAAYRDAMSSFGFQDHIHVHALPIKPDNDEILQQMLSYMPTAVVAFDDFRALQVQSFLQRRGIRIPQDIALIGFDDEDLGLHMTPQLTTTAIPFAEMGALATRKLIEKIEDDSQDIFQYVFPMSIRIRESC